VTPPSPDPDDGRDWGTARHAGTMRFARSGVGTITSRSAQAKKRAHRALGGDRRSAPLRNATVPSDNCRVPKTKYEVNPAAVERARELIDARQYVLNSDWGQVQPSADAQNRYLESHSWDDYAQWHLALTTSVPDGRKARYAFVFGDFRRLHRTGLIACVYRASEWRHKSVELAAHDLLQYLDAKTI
jgi:hypothetical protein